MAEILMQYGERRKLADKFSVSEVTVREALKFRTRSSKANMIRKAAIERLRVFFSADNIWTGTRLIENYDPEALSNNLIYPLSFTLSCGINLTF